MANTHQQQFLVIYFAICLFVVSLLMKVDSVRASTILLDGKGNMLQQHQKQQNDNNAQERVNVMDQTKQGLQVILPENTSDLEIDDNENLKGNRFNNDLTKSGFVFGHDAIASFKRAPGGFVGMRGKKFNGEDEEKETENNSGNSYTFPWSQLQNNGDDINWDEYTKPNGRRSKKAPTAFYGVRGKKFANTNGVNPNSDNNRWQDFLQNFEEEHTRDAILQDFIQRIAGRENDLPNEMGKRAPTGFTGVRGKRPFVDEIESSMETYTKRGLVGNAFVGVRGKKDISHQTFKRSPSVAEPLPNGGNKRQGFGDFSNKFVAVRGKKNTYDIQNGFNLIDINKLPSPQIMSLLYGKHTMPNGFFGMRVERPFTTDDVLPAN